MARNRRRQGGAWPRRYPAIMWSTRSATGWSSSPRRSAPSSNGTISSSTGRSPPVIGTQFFPAAKRDRRSFLLALASFGVGFGVRPLGAILFGYLGDRLGRKYTFLVTITLMGVATAAVGLLPTYAADRHRRADPARHPARLLQGLALGGEYGGAAIYVAEHAPRNKRGFYTSFIQAGVIGGFLLSVAVVLVSERCSSTRGAGTPGAGGSRSCSRSCCSPSRSGCG